MCRSLLQGSNESFMGETCKIRMQNPCENFAWSMETPSIACASVQDQGLGLVTEPTLPGGGKLGVYQPRHKRRKAK
jgi:hypothetical protein